MEPAAPKPKIIIAQVAGSGTPPARAIDTLSSPVSPDPVVAAVCMKSMVAVLAFATKL